MSKIGSTYVPSIGPEDAKVMLVGEAPGVDEERAGEPFVGKAGQFLFRYLHRATRMNREEFFITNLCKYRPAGNKFTNLLGSLELEDGLAELTEEINRVNPTLIVGLGNWPLYYLTGEMSPGSGSKRKPGTGISLWRGSTIPSSIIPGYKVLITYHPAFIIRPNGFANHPIFLEDLKRIPRESATREFLYPQYDSLINPPALPEIIAEMISESEWIAVDIETFGNSLACVGFTDSDQRGICVTYENMQGLEYVKALMESPKPKKIFQFGTFDINWMWKFLGWETQGYEFDTYIAAANLYPEFKKGLDFLCSIYTDFPFYKEERKIWKMTGDLTTYWEYNIKDVIATYQIAMKQMEEMR